MKATILARLKRLEEVRGIPCRPPEFQVGYLKELPLQYADEARSRRRRGQRRQRRTESRGLPLKAANPELAALVRHCGVFQRKMT